MRRAQGLAFVAVILSGVDALVAQDASSAPTTYAAVIAANYRPLEAVRRDRSSMPSKLARRVTLTRRNTLLQQVLLEISDQAGLGLSYGEQVALAGTTVSIDVTNARAADALTEAVRGTGWAVFVDPSAQITVVEAKQVPTGSIVGRVTDAVSKVGLKDADVFVAKTSWRTKTDSTGRFALTQVDSGAYTLTVRRLGYKPASRRVAVGGKEEVVDVALEAAAVRMDELVTTATGRQRRRDLGNAITTIKADSVLRTAPIRNLTDLLANRVPGMSLQHTSGAPGDPARIRLRGLSSVMRGNDPVVIVDGIRVYATQSEPRSGNLTNLADTTVTRGNVPAPSPLDQIDPNIIETIEVFKGPSAATLYGADAANGVIVITTKRGRPGPTRWDARLEFGRTTPAGDYPTGYYRWGHELISLRPEFCPITYLRCVQDSLVRYQALNDPAMTILDRGRRTALSLTASGGSQALTYSVTGSYADETGLLKLPDFETQRFRERFNREPPDWMRRPHHLGQWSVTSRVTALLGRTADVTLSTTLSRSEQQRTALENQQAPLAATYVDKINGKYYRPWRLPTTNEPGDSPLLVQETPDALADYYQRTTASSMGFTTGLTANWRPRSWLTTVGRAGLNVVPRDDETFRPGGLLAAADSGALARGTGRSLVSTLDLQGTLRQPLKWGFVFETSLGANVAATTTNDLISAASGLVPGTSSLAGATHFSATDARVRTSVFGWYLEPRVTGQRLSLSTGIRLDGGSTYGARLTRTGGGLFGGLLGLPKLNGSWVVSEEPWFPFKSLFSSLRLRGAYGQAQVQPGPMDRLRLYNRRIDPAGELLDLEQLGNVELRPERSTEFEGGFDADVLNSRLSVELTAYRKLQVDALMPVNVPPSVNGGGAIVRNIGNIRNVGLEVTARVTPVQTPLVTWSAELTYSRNGNTLTKLGTGVDPNPRQGVVAGYPVGSRWSRPILGFADPNGNGVIEPGEVQVGDSLVFLGRLLPAYTSALFTNVALFGGAIRVTAGLSYTAGATQVDETARLNWVLNRAIADPSAPAVQQALVVVADSTDYGLTQTVSTFRFNALAVNYRAPRRLTRLLRAQEFTLALQGANLGLHSTYRGKDPDVTAWSPTEHIADTGQLAQPRTWQLAFFLRY